MTTRTIWQKLKSTKLWCALLVIAGGVYIAMGGDPTDIKTVAGALSAVVAAVTYITTEGRIDAASIGQTVEKVQDAVDVITKEKEGK